jgi:hypothetical protein
MHNFYFAFWGVLFFLTMRFLCGSQVMGHGQRSSPVPPDEAIDPIVRFYNYIALRWP